MDVASLPDDDDGGGAVIARCAGQCTGLAIETSWVDYSVLAFRYL